MPPCIFYSSRDSCEGKCKISVWGVKSRAQGAAIPRFTISVAKSAAVQSFIALQSVRSVGMKWRGGQEISDRIFFHLQIVLGFGWFFFF